MCYSRLVETDGVSVRELRNRVGDVLRRVEAGERIRVTVNRRPVAEIVPLPHRRAAVPWSELQSRWSKIQADAALTDDLRHAVPATTDEV